MTVPVAHTRATVEHELDSARVWAARHGWLLAWDEEHLLLRATTYHPGGQLVEATGGVAGYRGLPPIWQFVRPGTDDTTGPNVFPAAGAQPHVGGSIFHGNRVICAPWNRLAYKEANPDGPHDDWLLAGWQTRAGSETTATTLADMLDQIHLHLQVSPGFLA